MCVSVCLSVCLSVVLVWNGDDPMWLWAQGGVGVCVYVHALLYYFGR